MSKSKTTSAARKLTDFSFSFLICLIVAGSGTTAADDTDVFFGLAADSGETRPNVMFILDTSGSMEKFDTYTDSRMDRMKDAMQRLLASEIDMNVGFMQFNGNDSGGPVLYPMSKLADNAEILSAIVDDLEPVGGTPTIDALYETALYMRGESVDYGKQRGASTVTDRNRAFFRVSHPDSYTGGVLVQPPGCSDANLSSRNCSERDDCWKSRL